MSASDYDVGEELARSRHHVVSRGVRKRDGRAVVIKQAKSAHSPEKVRRRLAFEYRVLGKLAGPGIIGVLELTGFETGPALVLEDFGAANLVLAEGERLPVGQLVDVALQLAGALSRVHSAGIIHKDVKPANVLLNRETGEVKLIDFQLATELKRENPEANYGRGLEGSLAYLAPEQTGRMNRSVDYRTDYYSLGVTLFQLATGQLPLAAADVAGWVHAHISQTPRLACEVWSELPPVLARIFARLMQKDPASRYQSSAGLIADLKRCQQALEAGGQVPEFELGQSDVSERFAVSQTLVGRERETHTLIEVFERASRGESQLLLVAGYAGVGKSSLIREVHKPVTRRHGRVVSGKFEQLERSVPYAALVQAVGELVRGLLSESDQVLATWKQKILDALGSNAQVMVDLVPELEAVTGACAPAAELSPVEAQRRFKAVFADFLRLFARPDQPLVIFLDDLQWTDASTPDLLVDLFVNQRLEHLLVIAAYRDNEVTEGHLLPAAVKSIVDARPSAVSEVRVGPLGPDDVAAVAAESLHVSRDEAGPLSRMVHEKTRGNPFFVTAMLEALHRQGAISFRHDSGTWGCDLEQVEAASITDNVVDLLVVGLESLPEQALDTLSVAACVGNQFSLRDVASLTGRTPKEAAMSLWEAGELALIEPVGDDYRFAVVEGDSASDSDDGSELNVVYRFRHDRVQQAAYSLIPKAERAAAHARIGRNLVKDLGSRVEERLFEVVNHLNLGRELIELEEEKRQLAALNRRAGERALSSTAYSIAVGYFEVALSLSEGASIDSRFDLRYRLAESIHMAGDLARAADLCDELAEAAGSSVSRASVQLLRARILESQALFVESVAAVREGLSLLGVSLPENLPDIEAAVGAGIGRMQASLAKLQVEDLAKLPDLKDTERLMAVSLLFQMIPAAIQTCPPLFLLAELTMFDIAVEHGVTPFSAKNFVDCGIIQGGILGSYDVAYRLGKVAFEVLARYDARAVASGVNFVFGAYVSSWRAPHEEALAAFDEGYRCGAETGDVQHMGFCTALRLHRLLHVGRELQSVREALAVGIAFLEHSHLPSQRTAVIQVERALARLADADTDPQRTEKEDRQATARVEATQNPQWIYAYAQSQMLVSVILGDYEAARRWGDVAGPLVVQAAGLVSIPEYCLCELLVLTQREWPSASRDARPELLEKARELVKKLGAWSECCPDNFAHKYHLAAAELARIEGAALEQVIEQFRLAVSTTKNAFPQMAALGLELEASYWRARDHRLFERALLLEARGLYAQWGARVKVGLLDAALRPHGVQDYESLSRSKALSSTTQTLSRETLAYGSLDVQSVLKAARAVASEVHGEGLFSTLASTLLENAAAERGALILPTESGDLQVEAIGDGSKGGMLVAGVLLEDAELCADVVRYVARSKKPVILDDARADDLYGRDGYVVEAGIKSLLCLPVVHQGQLVAVFYAENNAATRVFSPERVTTLHLIAGQAAVSLVNARLYDNLESKVRARTRELDSRNREIAAMLDGMDHGVLSIDEDLRILPRYSRRVPAILRSDDVAGRELLPLLFAGSDLGQDALSAMETGLRFSFGSPASLAGLNASHLVKEFSRQRSDGGVSHFEVDWKAIEGHDDTVDKFVVVVRDVTDLLQLRDSEERRVWEAQLVSRVLGCGVDVFRGFCASARGLLDASAEVLQGSTALTSEAVQALLRNLHTVKGNARSLELTRLVEAVHAAEGKLAGAERPDVELLSRRLTEIRDLLDEHEQTAARNLGALWSESSGPLREAIEAIDRALQTGDARPSQPVRALEEIRRTVDRVQSVALSDLLAETTRSFDSLARELHKHAPALDWTDDGTRLTRDWGRAIADALGHAVRNSLDHGIELPAEREALGKPERGRIRLVTEHVDGRLRIRLSDDGRGLDLKRLQARAPEGTAGSDEALADLVFASGVTTVDEVTERSGRGVGMHAVRSFVRERGGDVMLSFTGAASEGYRPFELVFDLPERALASGA